MVTLDELIEELTRVRVRVNGDAAVRLAVKEKDEGKQYSCIAVQEYDIGDGYMVLVFAGENSVIP
jgi:hypothetical protein